MSSKKIKFKDLVDEALKNAHNDRKLAQEAYVKMSAIWNDIDPERPETLQAVMFAGANTVKLLDTLVGVNDQVIKLAQLKQREEEKSKEEDEEEQGPIDLEALRQSIADKDTLQ